MKIDIAALRGVDAHVEARAELKARLLELEQEAAGAAFSDEQKVEFEELTGTIPQLDSVIEELEIRAATIAQVAQGMGAGQAERTFTGLDAPKVRKAPDNLFELAEYRKIVGSIDDLPAAYVEGAKRVLETASFPTLQALGLDKAKAQSRIADLLADKRVAGDVARRMIGTGSPIYQAAWAQYVSGGMAGLSHPMQAALQTYVDADGGFAIPFTIDPTFILTSNGVVNPLREISRIETITTKEWQGVTTAGVVAAYAAETAAAADGAPTDVAGPLATPVRAHVFVGFTAEYAEDYGPAAIQAELGGLVQDAKDVLEGDKFFFGTGVGQPEGIVAAIITDTTSIVPTITNDVFALADIDKLESAVPPRFRPLAKIVANRRILQLVRAFGTAGEPGNAIYDALSKTLRGYPAYEASAMDDVATDAKEIILQGDFRHFVIVDRIGLSTEYIPQVFDGNGLPLGRRGIYARWRNTSKVLTFNAFRLLRVQ